MITVYEQLENESEFYLKVKPDVIATVRNLKSDNVKMTKLQTLTSLFFFLFLCSVVLGRVPVSATTNTIYKAKKIINLQIHLKTCEIYKWDNCVCVLKILSGIEKHMREDNNECGSGNIFHIKTDRNNEDIACCTEYKQSELN